MIQLPASASPGFSPVTLFAAQVHVQIPPRYVPKKDEQEFHPFGALGILVVFFVLAIGGALVHRRIRKLRLKRAYNEELTETLSLTPAQRQLLAQSFAYYRMLSPANKLRFEHRVHIVMREKRIVVTNVQDSDWFVELIFASSLVQLTFGLSAFTLPHFKVVRILSDSFAVPPSGEIHKGLVSPKGAIVLSWKHMKEGIENPTDAFALGLHELAHALYIENFVPNSEYHFFTERQLDHWHKVAEDTLDEVREGSQSLLRQYAGTNVDELFAVGIEYFFEKPQALKAAHPKLYGALSSLLNQNPMDAADPVVDMDEAMDW